MVAETGSFGKVAIRFYLFELWTGFEPNASVVEVLWLELLLANETGLAMLWLDCFLNTDVVVDEDGRAWFDVLFDFAPLWSW